MSIPPSTMAAPICRSPPGAAAHPFHRKGKGLAEQLTGGAGQRVPVEQGPGLQVVLAVVVGNKGHGR